MELKGKADSSMAEFEAADIEKLGWSRGDVFRVFVYKDKATLIKIHSKEKYNETND